MSARFRPVSPREVPRFAGVSTFLRLPQHDDPRDVDVMILGAPFDGGTSFRPGARFGPRGVRSASALSRGFHPDAGLDLFDKLRCCDGGDVLCIPMDMARTQANIEARVGEVLRANALPALVGGDHSVTLGALRAVAAAKGPVGVIHFDAHSDTYPPAWDIDPHHGTIFRNAVEEGLLRPRDVIQIGVRGPFGASSDLDYALRHGFCVVSAEAVHRELDAVIARIRALPPGPYYVSFDVDALEPAMAPGTGTPVPGGIFPWQCLALLRATAAVEVVGCDVVEIAPDLDLNGITALLAANVLGEVLAGVASRRG